MQQLIDLAEQLAARSVLADATDLTSLADLHTQFVAIEHFAVEASGDARKSLSGVMERACNAGRLLERVILQEVSDTAVAMQSVMTAVAEIQQMIRQTETGSAPGDEAAPAASFTGTCASGDATPAPPAPSPAPAGPNLVESAINPEDLPLIQEFIPEATAHLETAEAELLKLEDDPHNSDSIGAIFRSFHTIKGVAGCLNLKQMGALAHTTESLLDLARHGQLQIVQKTADVVLEAIDTMKSLVAAMEASTKTLAPVPAHPTLPALLEKLRAAAAGTSNTAAVAAVAADNRPASSDRAPSSAASTAVSTTPAPPPPTIEAADGSKVYTRRASDTHDTSVKVATDRLDSLINMVGELVIAHAMVGQDAAVLSAEHQRLARNVGHLGKLTRELQELSMSMRMVPIQGVFQKTARVVRDLARKSGKEVELTMVGSETELDRNVVEAISDPLIHMVRNAVDHGIESPDVRQAGSKPRCGRIELKAYHHSGSIFIQISDDGKGLDKPRILRKAIEAGIVRADQELSEPEIFALIFHAGLSTAEKVTDVSGRGVGMDVVRRNVEALRGKIEIASEHGKGSTFTIRLPLTLAVIDGLVIRVGRERYIIPLTSVEQSIRPKADQLSTVQGRAEMCMVRDSLLPLFRLHRLFGVTPRTEDPTQALVVIVQDDQRRCCLLVDELVGQQQVVIKSLGEGIGTVRGVAGGAVLGDGNISLILDVPQLINIASGK